jgi:hypothetical protein
MIDRSFLECIARYRDNDGKDRVGAETHSSRPLKRRWIIDH